MQLAKESLQALNEKLCALERDVSELAKATTSAAGEKLNAITGGVKEQCEKSSKAAKEYVVENPAKATFIAGVAGFAVGYLVHLIRPKS